jgi:hypothetical protein
LVFPASVNHNIPPAKSKDTPIYLVAAASPKNNPVNKGIPQVLLSCPTVYTKSPNKVKEIKSASLIAQEWTMISVLEIIVNKAPSIENADDLVKV